MADYDVTEIFQQVEDELIASMCRNLSRHINEEQEANANYPQWQTKQLQALEKYRQENTKKYTKQFNGINSKLADYLKQTYSNAKTKTEHDIMKALFEYTQPNEYGLGVNQSKLDALINAVTEDFKKAEYSILRQANDLYRKTIYNAQVYLNTGSGTLKQAIDMATKGFLSSGINSIRYKNGNLVNIASYSEMALRTANKRATAYGEGEKRKEWDIHTVIVYGHNGACPLCSRWQNKVYIDDVWSDGKSNGKYPLLSTAIQGGLYHPNCKDPTPQTYIDGITDPPTPNTNEEVSKNTEQYNLEQEQRYNERQIRKYKRLEANSLDDNNKAKYSVKVQQWQSKQRELISAHPDILRRKYDREQVKVLNITEPPKNATEITPIPKNNLTSVQKSDNIKSTEMYRKKDTSRKDYKIISEKVFNNLTIQVRKNGGLILRGTDEIEKHLTDLGANAANIGDILLFRKEVCLSEVLEETYHFMQNKRHLNDDKQEPLRTYLNEIDAKQYLLDNVNKYKISRDETDLTKKQLQDYKYALENYIKEHGNYE